MGRKYVQLLLDQIRSAVGGDEGCEGGSDKGIERERRKGSREVDREVGRKDGREIGRTIDRRDKGQWCAQYNTTQYDKNQ